MTLPVSISEVLKLTFSYWEQYANGYDTDSLKETKRRLQIIMEGTEYAERISPIFARLNVLMTYLQSFGVKRKIYINPLSSVHDKFYRGSILFQCIFDSKRRGVFAAGGRYDRLIQEFSPHGLSNRPQAHAVGFNLGSDLLRSSMIDYLKAKAPSKDSETSAELYWTARRVSDFHPNSFDVIFADLQSVMYLLPALTPQSSVQQELN